MVTFSLKSFIESCISLGTEGREYFMSTSFWFFLPEILDFMSFNSMSLSKRIHCIIFSTYCSGHKENVYWKAATNAYPNKNIWSHLNLSFSCEEVLLVKVETDLGTDFWSGKLLLVTTATQVWMLLALLVSWLFSESAVRICKQSKKTKSNYRVNDLVFCNFRGRGEEFLFQYQLLAHIRKDTKFWNLIVVDRITVIWGFVCFSRSTRMWRSKGPACEMILRNINSEKHVCCKTTLSLKRKTSVSRNKCLSWSKIRQVFQLVSMALVAQINSCVTVWFCLIWTSDYLFSTFVLLLRL